MFELLEVIEEIGLEVEVEIELIVALFVERDAVGFGVVVAITAPVIAELALRLAVG